MKKDRPHSKQSHRSRKSRIKVSIKGCGNEILLNARKGDTVIDVLRKAGVHLFSPCGGHGICGKCLVDIRGMGRRLACRNVLERNTEITLPKRGTSLIVASEQKLHKTVDLDSGIEQTCNNNVVNVRYKGVNLCSFGTASPKAAVKLGMAIDIGTTTVVVFLLDLKTGKTVGVESFINPQAAYGHDVIARIRHTMEHSAGLSGLSTMIVKGINEAIRELCCKAGVSSNTIFKATIVGNPTMLHLFLGENPSSLARAPYAPVFTEAQQKTGKACGLSMNPAGVVLVLPSVAGFVGADVVAGMAATTFFDSSAICLYIDIGTNGEIAIGNRKKTYCCSTAAGPAFEGATLQCGVGGVEGAICSFAGGRYKTIGGCAPVGICGSGIIDVIAFLLKKEIIDHNGYMEAAYRIERKDRTATGAEIVLTPRDVREVQLAKAAIRAGITILAKSAGIGLDTVETVYLAGAFGMFMNIENAIAIGMLPRQLKDRIISVGNAAGYGARLALCSVDYEESLKRIASKARSIELSGGTDFNEEFVKEMTF
jgi:uncharacterized 2Fe-2S/4Fe-4S cluster protein (DUF4445 family)